MSELRSIAPGDLIPWPELNPRRHFAQDRLDELTASVKKNGVLQPLLVHIPEGDDWTTGWVVAGETRWRAATAAGLVGIPCMVREYTLAEALEVALLENLHRADLTPVEEARGFRRLIDETGLTHTDLATKVQKSQGYVANRMRLLELPDDLLELIEAGTIPPATARDVLLPFTKLTDRFRDKFFARVAKAIRKEEEDGPISSAELQSVIVDVGFQTSNSLQKGQGWGEHEVLIDAKTHEACGCGAPAFRWHRWSNEAEVRCFDPLWWKAANDSARQRIAERQTAKLEKAREQAALVSGSIISYAELEKLVGYQERTEIAYAGELGHQLYDPSLLPPESLLWARRNSADKVLALICTDPKAVKRAERTASKELKKRCDAHEAKQLEKDLRTIAEKPFNTTGLPALFAATGSYSFRDHLKRAAKDLNIEGLDGFGAERFQKVTSIALGRIASLIAVRGARGDLDAYNPSWKVKIVNALKKEYAELLPEPPTATAAAEQPAEAAPAKPAKKRKPRKKAAAAVAGV